jgi:hypothetical protein
MKNLYGHGVSFSYHKIKETNANVLMFQSMLRPKT